MTYQFHLIGPSYFLTFFPSYHAHLNMSFVPLVIPALSLETDLMTLFVVPPKFGC